ncbi:MAG: B12-binding domain-containing radical SAM protein [Bacteriovoracaceae bacterium]
MRILFLNPPGEFTLTEAPDEKGEGFLESDDFGNFPPLGLLYVMSYLEKVAPHHELIFHDCIAEKIGHKDIEELIRKINPDVVGITSFTIALVDIVKVAEVIKKVKPDCHICLGGHHPIAFPVQAAQLVHFDSVVVGEGEKVFAELISRLERKENFTDITGVYTRESIKQWTGKDFHDKRFLTHINVPAAYIDVLDELPYPNRKHLKGNYNSIVGSTKKMATILSTRGCPYLCTFCDVPYKKYRTRSISSVVDEIEECLKQGYEEFHFYDDLFNITPSKVIQFCDEVEKRGLTFHWDFRGRVNAVNEESIIRAKRAGCRQISFGVETGTNEGLKYLKKGTTVEKFLEVFGLCRKHGIRTIADYIIGFPFEKTREDVLRNIDFLCELDPDFAQIAVLMVLPNTPLFEEALQKGLIKKNEWEEFCLNPTLEFKISHWEEHLSLEELTKLQTEAYRRFYFRPRYIFRQIKNLDSWYDFTTKVKGVQKLLTKMVTA